MDLEVAREDLHQVRVVERPSPALAAGQARLRVQSFALTSNNITYAVFGDALRYWEFFPVPEAGDGAPGGWGRIPVWGFAEVVESNSDDLAPGERLYGYLPMSTSSVIDVGRADAGGVSDVAPHRAALAGAYNRYVRVAADPLHRHDREPHQLLLLPLFLTAFLLDDHLAEEAAPGVEQLVITSASAKTSLGLAHLAHQRGQGRVVGLTSAANRALVEELGVYDEVRPYDQAGDLHQVPTALVDVAGNRDVVHAVHDRLADRLACSIAVGATHWGHTSTAPAELAGPEPTFFFAPAQMAKRSKEWGREGLDARIGQAWHRYADWADGWIQLHRAEGPEAVVATYRQVLEGRSDPRAGHVGTLG